jgi:hypothetical protein
LETYGSHASVSVRQVTFSFAKIARGFIALFMRARVTRDFSLCFPSDISFVAHVLGSFGLVTATMNSILVDPELRS